MCQLQEPEPEIELIPHYSAMEQIHMHLEATYAACLLAALANSCVNMETRKKERREEEWMAAQQLNPGRGLLVYFWQVSHSVDDMLLLCYARRWR